MGAVEVYANGIVCCSACAPKDMPRDEVAEHVNALNPPGGDLRWRVSDDPAFAGGQPNPCECHRDPERLHYLLSC